MKHGEIALVAIAAAAAVWLFAGPMRFSPDPEKTKAHVNGQRIAITLVDGDRMLELVAPILEGAASQEVRCECGLNGALVWLYRFDSTDSKWSDPELARFGIFSCEVAALTAGGADRTVTLRVDRLEFRSGWISRLGPLEFFASIPHMELNEPKRSGQ